MTGTLTRRLAHLEAASGVTTDRPVIFVSFVHPDRSEPPTETATVNGCVWQRAEGEAEAAFLARVRGEAKPIRPGCGLVGFLA